MQCISSPQKIERCYTVHKAGPVYGQFQYIEHNAGLVLCILKLAIHRAGEISL